MPWYQIAADDPALSIVALVAFAVLLAFMWVIGCAAVTAILRGHRKVGPRIDARHKLYRGY
jgi:hypothetical protein